MQNTSRGNINTILDDELLFLKCLSQSQFLNSKIHFFTNVSFFNTVVLPTGVWPLLKLTGVLVSLLSIYWNKRALQGPKEFSDIEKADPFTGSPLLWLHAFLTPKSGKRCFLIFTQFSCLNPRRNISYFFFFFWVCISYTSF